MDSVYLKAKEERVDVGFDKKASVAEIIRLVDEEGITSKTIVCSKALKGKDFTNNDLDGMCDLYDEIEAEKKAMASVSIADATSQAEYIAELDKVKEHLDSAKWLAGVMAEKKVTTWIALKDLFPAEEIV